MNLDWIEPDWDAPAAVRAFATTRDGGLSLDPYAGLNLAQHVGDDPAAVAANRALLRLPPFRLPAEPLWLQQAHGIRVRVAEDEAGDQVADAAIARSPGRVCAVLTADCLPVLLCADDASVIGAVHAGWRGLAAGVIESCVSTMAIAPTRLLAWLGPAIGPRAFEVGTDVRDAFCRQDVAATKAFVALGPGKWWCDLYLLARQRLAGLGVQRISGGGWCTYADAQRFYSYRRDGITGRMASCIWLD